MVILFLQTFLIAASPCGERKAQQKVENSANQKGRTVDAGTAGGPVIGSVHEIRTADEGDDGGVLDAVDHRVDQRGQNDYSNS